MNEHCDICNRKEGKKLHNSMSAISNTHIVNPVKSLWPSRKFISWLKKSAEQFQPSFKLMRVELIPA